LQRALDAAASRRAAYRLETEAREDIVLQFAVARERDQRPVASITKNVGGDQRAAMPGDKDRAFAAGIQPFCVFEAQAQRAKEDRGYKVGKPAEESAAARQTRLLGFRRLCLFRRGGSVPRFLASPQRRGRRAGFLPPFAFREGVGGRVFHGAHSK